jgi:type II secretory pathway pseudopilin PulG
MKKQKIKSVKGITLIALVVTIVVLLILAGVSINALFGNSGIIEKAKEAQNAMDKAKENDEKGINELTNWIDNQVNGTTGGNNNPTTSDLPSVASETMPYYPDATFKKVEGTNLADGLVIQDESGNEYVWIEVPKSLYANSSYNTKTTTADQKPASSTEYDKIEYCLHKYTDYYRNGTSYTDTYYSDAATGLTSEQYTILKQKMLKSVYENGGFWIGRYEAGITTNRTSASGTPTEVPLSKVGTVENPVYPIS